MAYQHLDINLTNWPRVEAFVGALEGRYLVDVHHMLRLPLKNMGVGGGCNFSAAHTLLAAVSGVSTTLYTQRKGRYHAAFTDLLVDFYPWDDEDKAPLTKSQKHDVAEALWEEFRGALTHHAGHPMGWDKVNKQWAPAALGYNLVIKRWTKQNGNGLSESKLRILETSKPWPFPQMMTGTLVVDQNAKVLKVERFYWGVRQMVERIACSPPHMRRAEKYFSR